MCRMLIKRETDGTPSLARLTRKYAVITKDTTAKINNFLATTSAAIYLLIHLCMQIQVKQMNCKSHKQHSLLHSHQHMH